MKRWFLAWGYPEKANNDHIGKAVFGKSLPFKKSSANGISFVATYHLKNEDLDILIKDFLQFLYSDEEVEKSFPPPPL